MLKMISLAFNNVLHALKLPCYDQDLCLLRTKDSRKGTREAWKNQNNKC